jgi:hypothetical protein
MKEDEQAKKNQTYKALLWKGIIMNNKNKYIKL